MRAARNEHMTALVFDDILDQSLGQVYRWEGPLAYAQVSPHRTPAQHALTDCTSVLQHVVSLCPIFARIKRTAGTNNGR